MGSFCIPQLLKEGKNMSRKIDNIQAAVESRLRRSFANNKFLVLLIIKVIIFMLVTTFLSGFIYSTDDFITTMAYMFAIAFFIFIIPFERILFFSNSTLIVKRQRKSKRRQK